MAGYPEAAINMAFPRYRFLDAYVVEELVRRYTGADTRGRIALLRLLTNHHGQSIPYEVAVMAVSDEAVLVRQWLAQHAKYLDFSEREWRDGNLTDKILYPERNLWERLGADPDPFVRACLCENPSRYGFLTCALQDWIKAFLQATHIERLALVRNPNVGDRLLRDLFDYESQTLGLNLEEKVPYILAFLTNAERISQCTRRKRKKWDGTYKWEHPDLSDSALAVGVWHRIVKWPVEYDDLKLHVFSQIPTEDRTKADIYRLIATEEHSYDVLVEAILRSVNAKDTETITLGLTDKIESRRKLALEVLERSIERPEEMNLTAFQHYMKCEDIEVLELLTRMDCVHVWYLQEAHKKLADLKQKARKEAFWLWCKRFLPGVSLVI